MEKLYFISVIVHFVIVCRAERDLYSTETSILESTNEYVDPHSFYYDKETGKEVSNSYLKRIGRYQGENGDDFGSCERDLRLCKISMRNRPLYTDLADELLSRKLVNMILLRTKFMQEGQLFNGLLELEATAAELGALRKSGNERLTLREIDEILSRVIRIPTRDVVCESLKLLFDMSAQIYWAVSSSWTYAIENVSSLWTYAIKNVSSSWIYAIENKEMTAAVALTFFVAFVLKRLEYNVCRIVPFGIMTILIMDFFITWWKLIQEAEINHTVMQMRHMNLPSHCQPDTMSWWDSFKSLFVSNDSKDCDRYFESRMKIPFYEVPPSLALTHTLSHGVFKPLVLSGEAFGSFLRHITEGIPPFWAGIVRVVLCVTFFPTLFICFILFAGGGSLNFGRLGLLSLLSVNGPIKSRKRRNKCLENKAQPIPIEITLNVKNNSQSTERSISESLLAGSSNELVRDLQCENKESDITNNETDECTSKLITCEVNGSSGVNISKNDSSDSEDECIETEVKRDVKKSREVGSGDNTRLEYFFTCSFD